MHYSAFWHLHRLLLSLSVFGTLEVKNAQRKKNIRSGQSNHIDSSKDEVPKEQKDEERDENSGSGHASHANGPHSSNGKDPKIPKEKERKEKGLSESNDGRKAFPAPIKSHPLPPSFETVEPETEPNGWKEEEENESNRNTEAADLLAELEQWRVALDWMGTNLLQPILDAWQSERSEQWEEGSEEREEEEEEEERDEADERDAAREEEAKEEEAKVEKEYEWEEEEEDGQRWSVEDEWTEMRREASGEQKRSVQSQQQQLAFRLTD